jgi:hypothetical protein
VSLSCFRRPARPEDRPSEAIRQSLSLLGGNLDIDRARLAASTDEASYWILPNSDGELIYLYAAYHEGGGSGCATTLEFLREMGPSASIGIRGGRWRYAVLAGDGYDVARVGSARASIVDNLAVFDLPDRERFIEIAGPSGTRIMDLGPSGWDEFMGAAPGPEPNGP